MYKLSIASLLFFSDLKTKFLKNLNSHYLISYFLFFFYEYKFTVEKKQKQKKTFTRHLGI